MKKLILICVIFYGCKEDVTPEPNSTCVYKRSVSTNGSSIGSNPYRLVNCFDDPLYQSQYVARVVDCRCPSRP